MLRSFLLAGIVAFAVSLTSAQAQYGDGGYAAPYYASSTVEGDFAHGYADLVRSAGVFNLLTSKAFENYEKARQENIRNRLLWTQTYFEMRRINDEYRRAQYERDRRTQED